MNILIISFASMSKMGGAETYHRTLVQCFKDKHNFFELYRSNAGHSKDIHDIFVKDSIWLNNPYDSENNFFKKITNSKKWYFFFEDKVKTIINKYKIDLIINSEPYNLSSDKIGVPIIDVQHTDDPFYKKLFYPSFYTKVKRKLTGRQWNYNYFVTFSRISENNIFKKNKPKKIWNIPICKFNKNEINNLNKDKDKIVFIGRLSKEKNIPFLNKISEILKKENLQIEFYGDGPKMKKMKKYNNFYGSKNADEIVNILSNTRVLVMASKYEGFPVSVVEALSNGVPCVIVDSYSNAKYLIGDNKRGILVEKFNKKKFANEIISLYYSNSYNKISDECIKFSKKELSLENFKNKWFDIFNYVEKKDL